MGTDAFLWALVGFSLGCGYSIVLSLKYKHGRRWQNLDVSIDDDGVVRRLVVDGVVLVGERNDRAEAHKEEA